MANPPPNVLSPRETDIPPIGCPYHQTNANGGILETTNVNTQNIPSCPYQSQYATKGSLLYNKLVKDDWENKINPLNQMPEIPNKNLDNSSNLSTHRQKSSIPKTGSDQTWVYPSPQQFYNSLRRKNKTDEPNEMDATVYIHNWVNEESWKSILRWESMHRSECETPTLTRFHGKSEELSPKAKFYSLFTSYGTPFDRHDWYIDRCGKSVRYIIDYYDSPKQNDDIQIYIDVRPAFDTFSNVWDRLRWPFWSFINKLKN